MATGAIRFGGRFVVEESDPVSIVTPEDFSEEQRMMSQAAEQFLETELLPRDAEIEGLNYELTVQLMRKAGELGLLGADVPEQYGGIGLDKVSTTLLAETMARASSFALSVGAHTGIGTLPIVFFGTQEQKERYLPDLASGSRIAAYCLTEPASGSDALGARTTAKLTEDGNFYVLNGSKLYITNAGFADVFIVYAKVDGDKFTAFIVEREMAGFSIGPEEHKMGIKGSSTCPLFFEDVHVPVENVLGDIGKGHLIAFNILNIGRFKLGAACLGSSKESIELASAYANTRKQFGRELSKYPLIGAKLADMNIRTFVLESMVYRIAGYIDSTLGGLEAQEGGTYGDAGSRAVKAISEYAIECSILKVFASEALDFVIDEGVQIHGGYGYIREYKVERIYRDSRINRIFEGTNEINRMLIPGTLLKKAMKGELPLMEKTQALMGELMQPMPVPAFSEPLDKETYRVAQAKKAFLAIGGLAVQKLGLKLDQEQEVLCVLADLMIQTFAMESVLLRTKKMLLSGSRGAKSEALQLALDMTEVFVQEAMENVESLAKTALSALERGDGLQMQLSVLKKLMRAPLSDTIALKRGIAAHVIRSEHYVV
ncbi:acyl-CoA dehydrogenase family protein [Paenibacillus sp. strain BS8-2]